MTTKSPHIIHELTHHAYVIVGGPTVAASLVQELETIHNIPMKANPDFTHLSFDTFTIDNAREIKTLHETKPLLRGAKKVFVLVMNGITVEAQNALLKLLEEPALYAHFFIIIPSSHVLLPTIKSRIHLIQFEPEKAVSNSETKKIAQQFLKLTPAKRLDYIKELVDEISKETKIKQDAINFLNDIEAALYDEKGARGAVKALRIIDHARGYMNDRAPSVKMLLEYVALNV